MFVLGINIVCLFVIDLDFMWYLEIIYLIENGNVDNIFKVIVEGVVVL